MTRTLLLVLTLIAAQGFTWVLAKSLHWLGTPYLTLNTKWLYVGVFILSNLCFATMFIGEFRIAMTHLTLLWFVVMAAALTASVNVLLHKLSIFHDSMAWITGVRVFAVGSLVGLLLFGLYNAYTPTVRHLHITTNKPLAQPITIALVSDLHLGSLFGKRQLYALSDILSRENVDMLLMAGDIMDDDTHIYDSQQMKPAFEAVVAAAQGRVFASLGNHDLYNRQERFAIASAIRATNTVLLDDKVTQLNWHGTPINIVGRFDDHAAHRLSTQALLKDVPSEFPTILLDHRPSEVEKNASLPIDLQVSGHTHNGQIFPANFIVKALNAIAYGHGKFGDMNVVVSSGYGFWGVPLRLGSQSEVWVIKMSAAK